MSLFEWTHFSIYHMLALKLHFAKRSQVGAAMALNFLAIAITFLLASSVSDLSLAVGKLFLTGFSGLFVFWNWPSILFTWISSRLSVLRNEGRSASEED